MNYQPKVNNTQKYEDSQGSHIVTPAKLILIECNDRIKLGDLYKLPHKSLSTLKHGDSEFTNKNPLSRKFKPILISETEEIREGDKVYGKYDNQIHIFDEKTNPNKCYKILVLPEHFSDKHLQAIVDRKMQSGDEVLVKCEDVTSPHHGGAGRVKRVHEYYQVDIDYSNHITLFPVKQSPQRHQALSVRTVGGTVFNIGDKVTHSGAPEREIAIIESFYWSEVHGEIRANTTEGNAGLEYLSHVLAKQSLKEVAEEYELNTNLTRASDHFIEGAEWSKNNNY